MWNGHCSTESSALSPPPRLSDDDAFAIATHWREQLLNVVQLETDDAHTPEPVAFVDATCSVVAHFEWVTFQGPISTSRLVTHEDPWVGAARASILVWLALASCPGFSSRENPRFWKRVFSALCVGRHGRQIADEVGFFEHPDRPFPSVRIDFTNGVSTKTLRAFYNGARHDQGLKRVLQRIEPYMTDRECWNREIPVEIVGFALPKRDTKIRRRWFVPPHRRPSSRKPAFRLVAVRIFAWGATFDGGAYFPETGDHALSTAAFRSLSSVFEGTPVHIAYCRTESRAPSIFLLERQATTRCVNVETMRLSGVVDPNYSAVAAMCSALPHSQIPSALEIDCLDLVLGRGDGAWLGYALFHPDSSTSSSLAALTFRLPLALSTLVNQLGHMAAGNNLLLVMGVTSVPSSAYYETRLARRTCVHEDGSVASQVVYKFSSEQTVTLCITAEEDVTRNEWVRIVVPGIGLGWVQTKHIASVVARAPGRPPLHRLQLFEFPLDIPRQSASPLIARMVSLLGTSLTHVKILVNLDNQDLWAVLHSCPQLRALRVIHDGACWSHASAKGLTGSTARLETLELLVSGHLHHLVAPELGDMTCLRVFHYGAIHEHFTPYRNMLLAMLQNYTRLAHVYWSTRYCNPLPWWETSRYRPWWTPTFDSDPRDWQSTSYQILGEGVRGILDSTQSPLPMESRIAFLSVLHRSTTSASRSLPALTSDVARLVFTFSVTRVPRQLLIRHSQYDPID